MDPRMTPTISDFQTLLAKAKRQYAMAIVATNDAEENLQYGHRILSYTLRDTIISAESLVKLGRTQQAYDYLKGKI
jgi:hypothetical protein